MKYYILIALTVVLTSCGSLSIKKKSSSPQTTHSTSNSQNPQSTSGKTYEATGNAREVLSQAKKYIGIPYKFGGTTSEGFDCSGLVKKSFEIVNLNLPRVSKDQANAGLQIKQTEVKPGDLVFFDTSGKGISHVGIIESIKNNEIFFIHSSTSKGVMISSLENSYWKPKLVKFTRVL